MSLQEASEEYRSATRLAQKEYKELVTNGKDPYPAVLDDILPDGIDVTQDIGVVEIPTDRILGTKSAGRITAFTASFRPLLDLDSEFATKWIRLCADHLGEAGIRDPIECFEYLGNFYVQEGNKRVSVLRHFGAPRVSGSVKRIVPAMSDEPHVKAYYEFMDFYKASRIYDVQFRTPGCYDKLLARLGKEKNEEWTDRERRTFSAYYQYFREAFYALGGRKLVIRPEEALLLWLRVYPFQDLGRLSAAELKKVLAALWEDIVAVCSPDPVQVQTAPATDGKVGILGILKSAAPDQLSVAFIHQRDPQTSIWTKSHDEGRQHLEQILPGKVKVKSYYHADNAEQAETILNQAVAEGAQVVFTTTPQLSRATLKAAVKYPKVRFLNCSVNVPYPSIRSYYSRIYEGKFITGAIAGAMSKEDKIGYVGDYPIFGVPACINAFALGAQMTNPDARIQLRWSCLPGSPVADFMREGIQVTSNRDVPTTSNAYLDYGIYGTYQIDEQGSLVSLASPCWLWGRFYENVIRSILSGAWDNSKDPLKAVNYWWGMDSGVIDVKLSDRLPDGVRALAKVLARGMRQGSIDPFFRRIVAQDGTVKNDGSRTFTPDELLHMDWLCQNVDGSIPAFDEILPIAQPTVRELGVYRDNIPEIKEGSL